MKIGKYKYMLVSIGYKVSGHELKTCWTEIVNDKNIENKSMI